MFLYWYFRFTLSMERKAAYDEFCSKTFGGARSKSVTKEKGDRIIRCLKFGEADSHFKHYVKTKGFRLMQFPSLRLKDVLCLPVAEKDKVSDECRSSQSLGWSRFVLLFGRFYFWSAVSRRLFLHGWTGTSGRIWHIFECPHEISPINNLASFLLNRIQMTPPFLVLGDVWLLWRIISQLLTRRTLMTRAT